MMDEHGLLLARGEIYPYSAALSDMVNPSDIALLPVRYVSEALAWAGHTPWIYRLLADKCVILKYMAAEAFRLGTNTSAVLATLAPPRHIYTSLDSMKCCLLLKIDQLSSPRCDSMLVNA